MAHTNWHHKFLNLKNNELGSESFKLFDDLSWYNDNEYIDKAFDLFMLSKFKGVLNFPKYVYGNIWGAYSQDVHGVNCKDFEDSDFTLFLSFIWSHHKGKDYGWLCWDTSLNEEFSKLVSEIDNYFKSNDL